MARSPRRLPPADPRLPTGRFGRRSFLKGGVAAGGVALGAGGLSALLAACGDDADTAATTITGASSPSTDAPAAAVSGGDLATVGYQLSWLPTVEHAGTYVAIERGYFAEEGVEVSINPGGPNVATVANVVSGQTLIGADGADNAGQAVAEGAPIKIFAARLQKNPLCVMSLAGTPITSPADLLGKRIGVAQGNQVPWQIFLSINDIDESDISVVPVQFDPGPTANGEVDGQVVFYINEPAQLEAQGIETSAMLFADHGFDIYAGCYFATEETLAERPDDLAGFLRAERRGFADVLSDPEAGMRLTIDDYGSELGLDEDQQLLQAELLADVMVTPTTEDRGLLALGPDDVEANIETLGVAGVDVTAEQLFTTEILDRL